MCSTPLRQWSIGRVTGRVLRNWGQWDRGVVARRSTGPVLDCSAVCSIAGLCSMSRASATSAGYIIERPFVCWLRSCLLDLSGPASSSAWQVLGVFAVCSITKRAPTGADRSGLSMLSQWRDWRAVCRGRARQRRAYTMRRARGGSSALPPVARCGALCCARSARTGDSPGLDVEPLRARRGALDARRRETETGREALPSNPLLSRSRVST